MIRIVRDGIHPPELQPGRWMPGFAGSLDDEQITALLTYLRHQAADAPPWPNLAAQVTKAKSP
jgi:mono/diheme cytochrome c family protein